MFNISDIINAAHGGDAIANIAQQFGLSQAQAQSAIDALIPAVSHGLQQQATDPSALGDIVSTVASDGAHKDAFTDPKAAFSDASVQQGSSLLGQIFGGGKTDDVAQHAAQLSGVSPSVIQQIMPILMSLIAGGLFHSMQSQGLGGILGQLAGAAGGGGGLGGILGHLGGGATTSPSSGGGLTGMLGGLLGGLFGRKDAPTASPGQGQPADQASSGGLLSGLGSLISMFQPGVRVPQGQQQSLDNILGGLLGGRR